MSLPWFRWRVWHWMIVIAMLGTGLWAGNLGPRWRTFRHHARSLANGIDRNNFQADFLVRDVPTLRGRPEVEGREAYYAHSGRWMVENRVASFPINHEEWVEAFRRDDAQNRAEASRLRSEATSMGRARLRFEARWW